MNVNQITLSQVVVFFAEPISSLEPVKKVWAGDFFHEFAKRYRFLQVPTSLDDFDLDKGVTYRRGIFSADVVVETVKVFGNGVLCEGTHDTDKFDEFLTDAIDWAADYSGTPMRAATRAYLSNLEVQMPRDIRDKMERFSAIGNRLTDTLRSYGQSPNPFAFSGFELHCDVSTVSVPRPPAFSFTRRAGRAYSEDTYFSSAPLKTTHHVEILESLEALF